MSDEEWERAYQRFESPQEEVRKFVARLRRLRALELPRSGLVLEVFCGRGGGIHAWNRLGFMNVIGVDRSERLLTQYRGPMKTVLADCRALPFRDGCADAIAVHGGLHHLERIPADLDQVLRECRRVLRRGGAFFAVEPWRDLFLDVVHVVSERRVVQRALPKLHAFAEMNRLEAGTYYNWLGQPEQVLASLHAHFSPRIERFRFGKLEFRGA
jgi:SAM-dependent methyltransferase